MRLELTDNYGDAVTLSTSDDEIYVEVADRVLGVEAAVASLSPKKARKLAKALKRAAKEARR